MDGKPVRSRPPRFDQLDHTITVPVAVENPKRRRLMQFIDGVAPPVAAGQIHPSVTVEIARSNTRPPTRPVRETPRGGHILEAILGKGFL